VTFLSDHLLYKLAILRPQNGQWLYLRIAYLSFAAVWWRKQGESTRSESHWRKVE